MQSLGAHTSALPKAHFKTPEGRYELVGERLSGLCNFSASRVPRLTLAVLEGGEEEGCYLVFSIQDVLHICRYTESAKVLLVPAPELKTDRWSAGVSSLPQGGSILT